VRESECIRERRVSLIVGRQAVEWRKGRIVALCWPDGLVHKGGLLPLCVKGASRTGVTGRLPARTRCYLLPTKALLPS
jgi:hypothetical protein